MQRRRLRGIDGRTAANGLFIAGNRSHRIERDGTSIIIGPGDLFPEAGSLPPRRLRLLLDRGDVMFVPHQGVSRETIRGLVAGMTKAAKDELKASLELVTDKSLSREEEAELVVDALLEAEVAVKVEEIKAEFARQRIPKPHALPPAQTAPTPRPSIPPAHEWRELGIEGLLEAIAEVQELEVERAIKDVGLLAQVIGRIQDSERKAKKDESAHVESFRDAAIAVIKERIFLIEEDEEPVAEVKTEEEAELDDDEAELDGDTEAETTEPTS